MDSISITSKEDIEINKLRKSLSTTFELEKAGPGRIVIEEKNSRVYIDQVEKLGVFSANRLFVDYTPPVLTPRARR
jgi:hypothetical protein